MYTLICGFSSATVRASIMLTIYLGAKTIAKNQNSLNILALSAFIQLYHNPFLIFEIGFQLSYLAVWGLILYYPLFKKYTLFKYKLLQVL
ncbi:MAG: hypothetical protein EOO99_03250 [Pedobacter sp.]|nr:MAG: hypothetical protein EOO99_03250 [Pedobacter sp.]